jgi:hypothetical protein
VVREHHGALSQRAHLVSAQPSHLNDSRANDKIVSNSRKLPTASSQVDGRYVTAWARAYELIELDASASPRAVPKTSQTMSTLFLDLPADF